jgi:hypothetical protein
MGHQMQYALNTHHEGTTLMMRNLKRRLRDMALAGALLGSIAAPVLVAAPAQAAAQTAHVQYYLADGLGNVKYHVVFYGTVYPEGPYGYRIVGDFSSYCGPGALTAQSVRLDWRESGGSWSDRRFWCDNYGEHIDMYGSRSYGNSVDITVGATSGVFNTYGYSGVHTFHIGVS